MYSVVKKEIEKTQWHLITLDFTGIMDFPFPYLNMVIGREK